MKRRAISLNAWRTVTMRASGPGSSDATRRRPSAQPKADTGANSSGRFASSTARRPVCTKEVPSAHLEGTLKNCPDDSYERIDNPSADLYDRSHWRSSSDPAEFG